MLNRHQLTITAVASFLTDSTDFALTLVNARKVQEDKEQESQKRNEVPWKLLAIAGGSVITGLLAYMKSVDSLVPPGLDEGDSEGSDKSPIEGSDSTDDGQSLLDKVSAWITSITASEAKVPVSSETTVPQAPSIVSTDSGQAFLGPTLDGSASSEGTTVSYITRAAKTVGIDPELAFSVSKIESNLKVNAKNRITGATGLNQITPSTWKFLIKKYPSLGFTESDINDPQKNAIMGAVYLKQISDTLKKQLGREPSVTEVYLGHFLGPSGAIRFLQGLAKNPEAIAAQAFPSAANANPNIFFDGKTPRTIAQVFDLMNNKVSKAQTSYRQTAQSMERTVPVVDTLGPSTQSTSSAPASSVPVAPTLAVPKDTSVFLSAKVTSRLPGPDQVRDPEAQLEPTHTVAPSSPPAQNKTYARTKQGTLVALALPN